MPPPRTVASAQAPDPYDLKPFAEQLKTLVNEKILTVVDSARQFYLVMALRNELYWRGKQFLTMKFMGDGITVIPATGVPGSPQIPANATPPQSLAYTFNITRSDGQKFVAVTGARPPYVNIEPQDPRDPESIQAGRDGDAVSRYLEELWDTQGKQKDVARTIFRTGPQFANVTWVADEDKYGAADVHDVQLVNQSDPGTLTCPKCGFSGPVPEGTPPGASVPCPNCGFAGATVTPGAAYQAPKMVKTGTQPKGMPELHFYNVFEVTIPPQRKSIKECEWLVNEVLEISGKMREQYGDLVKDIKDETPSGVEVPSQESVADHYDIIASADLQHRNRQDRWWHTRVFLKPEMYHYAQDDLKKVLQEGYPDGLRLVMVNGNFVQGVAENLEDVWTVCKTGTDDRILSDPICHDLVPINTIINDFFNMALEIVLRSIPKTIVNPRLIDRRSVQNNTANAYEILFANTGLSEDLGKMMHSLPQASFSEQMMELANLFRQYSREFDGALEAVFGGGEPAPTWRQDQQRKNQALGQFYMAYDEMRQFWEQNHRLAHKLLAKYGVGQISVPTDDPFRFGPRVVDFTKLRPELIRVESDEKMPETRAEEEDRLTDQFAFPPQVQDAIGLFHPVNTPRLVGLTSMRGMTSVLEHLTVKCLKLIQRLLQEQPIQQFDPQSGAPMTDPQSGQPVEQPSVTPDPFDFKNAAFAVEIFRAFINSPAGSDYEEQSADGFRNVRLFGNALDQMANPPAQPEPPRATVGLSLKGADLGDPAVQAALINADIIPSGTPVAAVIPPPKIAGPPGKTPPGAKPAQTAQAA